MKCNLKKINEQLQATIDYDYSDSMINEAKERINRLNCNIKDGLYDKIIGIRKFKNLVVKFKNKYGKLTP